MHWIIQNNLYQEAGHTELLATLERMEIPHSEVAVVPFSHGLPPEERMIPFIKPEGLVMVCGSTSLANFAATMGWTPGSFHNENHDYRVWKEYYGNHLLNADARVCRFGDVEHIWDDFFIRPCEDTKTFSGQAMDWMEFLDWQKRVLVLKETYTTLDADTMVSYGPLKHIYREARFFVIDGKIVTYSTYKIGSRVQHIAEVPPTMIDYANKIVSIWQPARAFVLDIALTDDEDDGYCKVVEINCINAAGFYAIDINKFVGAIESMEF